MFDVQSTSHEWVKLLRSLHTSKGRKLTGLFLIEGEKLVQDALTADFELSYCLYDPQRCSDLAARIAAAGGTCKTAAEHVIAAASEVKTHQGIVAAAKLPAQSPMNTPLLALDGVQDPGNLGTLLRTAEAAGFGGALLGEGTADPFSPKAMRGSMGAVLRLPVETVPDLANRLEELVGEGWEVAATVMQGEDFFAREPMKRQRVLVIGSEGSGISPAVLDVCTLRFTLPMAGGAESLNAAVAAGIMMFDWFREGR